MGGGGPEGGVSHPFPQATSAVCGTHPHAFVCTLDCQWCCGACSTSVSRLLQPPVCSLEDLGVVATCHRPVSSQSLRGCVALPDGDHPVCSSVCPSGGLDGLHRPSGSVSPGSCPSGVSSLPSLCGPWPHLPVQSAVLRSVHGPQVFTRVMAPVLTILHSLGIRMRRTWTTGSSSPPPGRVSSGTSRLSCPSVGSWGS